MNSRIVGVIVIALLSAQAMPMSAGGMSCSMARPTTCEHRAACAAVTHTNGAPTFVVATCCRFEQPPIVSSLPGLASSSQRSELAAASAVHVMERVPAHSTLLRSNPSARQVATPPPRATILRL
jgi:hypothetical protein